IVPFLKHRPKFWRLHLEFIIELSKDMIQQLAFACPNITDLKLGSIEYNIFRSFDRHTATASFPPFYSGLLPVGEQPPCLDDILRAWPKLTRLSLDHWGLNESILSDTTVTTATNSINIDNNNHNSTVQNCHQHPISTKPTSLSTLSTSSMSTKSPILDFL